MHPILVQFGPFAIRWYGLMYVTAMLVGGWLVGKEVARKSIPLSDDARWNFITIVFLCGILGGRIYYVLFNWRYYGANPAEIPAIWHGGLAIHGGLIGGAAAGFWYVTRHRLPFWKLSDAVAPSIILGQAFGRFGNFMNGEVHGTPTNLPWGIVFPPDSPAGREFGPVPLHPAMLYELVLNLMIFGFLWSIRKRPFKDGFLFCLYLMLYSVARFFVSLLRAEDLYLGPFRAPHVVSVVVIVVVGSYVVTHKLWRADSVSKKAKAS
jgi:phosphatidylglycerol---prolipoprotein diacylglyceryl transferase